MAWTAPYTFTTGQVVTAAIMNTYISDNLNYLAGLKRGGVALSALGAGTEIADIRSDRAQISANVDRTGATTYADVTGMTVSPVVKLTGVITIWCEFRATQVTAGNGTWQIARTAGDGTLQNLATRALAFGNSADFVLIARNTGHTAITQTFALQQKTDNAGGTVRTERGQIIGVAQ